MTAPRWGTTDLVRTGTGAADDKTVRAVLASDTVTALVAGITPASAAGIQLIQASGVSPGTGKSLDPAFIGNPIHLEVGGEVYVKLGAFGVLATADDYHFHLLGGGYRDFSIGAHTYIAILGVGGTPWCSLWRTDGV